MPYCGADHAHQRGSRGAATLSLSDHSFPFSLSVCLNRACTAETVQAWVKRSQPGRSALMTRHVFRVIQTGQIAFPKKVARINRHNPLASPIVAIQRINVDAMPAL